VFIKGGVLNRGGFDPVTVHIAKKIFAFFDVPGVSSYPAPGRYLPIIWFVCEGWVLEIYAGSK